MPLVIHPRTAGKRLLRVAAVSAVACLAGTGVAQAANCPAQPTSKAFAAFGDTADFSLVPGGTFETGAPGWSLNGNTLAAGNEKFHVNGADDSHSLVIRPGSSVVSPSFCVDATYPYLRFFSKTSARGVLKVDLVYTDGTLGKLVNTGWVVPAASGAWAPTSQLKVASLLPFSQAMKGTFDVKLRITALADGPWSVDDVLVDPYRGS
jgi:hypothetical protein